MNTAFRHDFLRFKKKKLENLMKYSFFKLNLLKQTK